ncbi:MAG: BREX-4 system phosphatase PglZ [Candidatus Cloacimonetes bacterium]|nr:BREX-4 system phosphatase PglZ [Candidatus Cloacimonadota bacterium]
MSKNESYQDDVKYYLESENKLPFFLCVGDEDYSEVKNQFILMGFDFVNISEFCRDPNRWPDLDKFENRLRKGDNKSKIVVLGLGEYLALRGGDELSKVLDKYKDKDFPQKIILLLRGVKDYVLKTHEKEKSKFLAHRFYIIGDAECNISFETGAKGDDIKNTLQKLENGEIYNKQLFTEMNVDNSTLHIKKQKSPLEKIIEKYPGWGISSNNATEEQWLWISNKLENKSIEEIFQDNGISNDYTINFAEAINPNKPMFWLYFLALKYLIDMIPNSYLCYVLRNTEKADELKFIFRDAILDIFVSDAQFKTFYNERKSLLGHYNEAEINTFIEKNRENKFESLYKLTDKNLLEKQEIIRFLIENQYIDDLPKEIKEIYNDLTIYMVRYNFLTKDFGGLSASLLSNYFHKYKWQKLFNYLDQEFLKQVDDLAISRDLWLLPYRNDVINPYLDDDTYLYWLDALGLEYLSFIENITISKGLSFSVEIARTDIPTITPKKDERFRDWLKNGVEDPELDQLKHREKVTLPTYLARELEIIRGVVEKAEEVLNKGFKRFLLVSDHGASRLALLHKNRKEHKIDKDFVIKPRFCKKNEVTGALPFILESEGHHIIANYDRLSGTQSTAVEVHGGATLEEVIVPIILIEKKKKAIKVILKSELPIQYDLRKGAEIEIFFESPVNDLEVFIDRYEGKIALQHDTSYQNYRILCPDLKRVGNYILKLYDKKILLSEIDFIAENKGMKANDPFG